MADETLFNILHCSETDQAEFEQIVSAYFGHGAQLSSEEISYGRVHKGSALRLMYDENGLLQNVLPGPDLVSEDIPQLQQKIEAELLTRTSYKIRKRILFVSVPVEGWFRYRDKFQILPMPANAPKPTYLMGAHPFILEFRYPNSPDFMISNLRQGKIGRELELACSALLSFRIQSIGPETRHHWVFQPSEDGKELNSVYLQEGYACPGLVGETNDFTATDGLVALKQVEPGEYLSLRGISPGQALDVPSDFELSLDKFFALSGENRDRFLRASYWFQLAGDVFSRSKSAAFVALVSAIEALIPRPEKRNEIGPTKLFTNFVEAQLPGTSIPEAERKRFYALRSDLSHGGTLLSGDHASWGFTQKGIAEGNDMRMVWWIVQVVLRNWLITR
jgi:hypothetical protein